MDKSHQKAQETRKRNQALREERQAREQAETQKQIVALKLVRDDPESTSTERLEAVKLLADYEKRGYSLSILKQMQ